MNNKEILNKLPLKVKLSFYISTVGLDIDRGIDYSGIEYTEHQTVTVLLNTDFLVKKYKLKLSHKIIAANKLALIFDKDTTGFKRFMDCYQGDIHDDFINIKNEIIFNHRNVLKQMLLKDKRYIELMSSMSSSFISELELTNISYTAINEKISKLKYKNILSKEVLVATEGIKVSEEDFNTAQKHYLNSTGCDFIGPNINIINGEYSIVELQTKDPIKYFIGAVKNIKCCMYINGVGESYLLHSIESPLSTILLLKKNETIIAQIWLWLDKSVKGVVIDSVESAYTGKIGVISKLIKQLSIDNLKNGYSTYIADTSYGITKKVSKKLGLSKKVSGNFCVLDKYKGYMDGAEHKEIIC